jgi:cell division protein FtsX
MNVDATRTEVDAVRAAIASDPQIASSKYLDKDAAYREFTNLFRDNPALIESTTPDALPESFRVVPVEGVTGKTISDHYKAMAGVNEVTYAGDSLCP